MLRDPYLHLDMEGEKEKGAKKQLKLLDNLEDLVGHDAQERGALGKDVDLRVNITIAVDTGCGMRTRIEVRERRLVGDEVALRRGAS